MVIAAPNQRIDFKSAMSVGVCSLTDPPLLVNDLMSMPRDALKIKGKSLMEHGRVHLDTVLKSGGFAIAKDCERFSLSAFCGVCGAKWGEGRGEVLRLSI
jgi:hypothetical protein